MEQNIILRIENLCKYFPGVKALDNVSVDFRAGEVHALVGENGAGKSTMIKSIMGVYERTSGTITYYYEGSPMTITNPLQANQYGLKCSYQDLQVARELSIGENFFLGKLPVKNGRVQWKRVYEETEKILAEAEIEVDPREVMGNLTIGQQAMITIAKIASEDAKLIIFDEPTALLAGNDCEKLFRYIRRLKEKGIAIIYISHRLEEVINNCDIVTVLKDGKHVRTCQISEVDENKLIGMMVGRQMDEIYQIKRGAEEETVLEVKNLGREGVFKDINFELKKGEILGFFGLVGAGRTEVMRCIYGADHATTGEIFVHGKKRQIKSPVDAMNCGIGLVPEDRRKQGLALALDVNENINLSNYHKVQDRGIVKEARMRQISSDYVDKMSIKVSSIRQIVGYLSGGNQQKVVIAKMLNRGSEIIIMDEPTVGVDVGAKGEIYSLIEKEIQKGNSVIFISSYLPEVLGLADRIVVMYEGRITGVIGAQEVEALRHSAEGEKTIMKYASDILEGIDL